MDNNSSQVLIGEISACIAGDRRYTSKVKVYLRGQDEIVVERHESTAAGGMDSLGGSNPFKIKYTTKVSAKNPAAVVKAVKASFDSTITHYGKPAKNFEWYVDDEGGEKCLGLSAAKVASAITWGGFFVR